MFKSVLISSSLHIFIMIMAFISLPFIAKKPLNLTPIISVELIQIAEKTNIPYAPKAKKIIEKKKRGRKIGLRASTSKKNKKNKTRGSSYA